VSGDDDAGGGEPDGGPPADPDAQVEPSVAPEIDGRITINEFMTDNALTIAADGVSAGDWIELYNPTEVDVPIHGYAITDDLAAPGKAVIASGVVVPAGGRVVLLLDGTAAVGNNIDMRLAREGGTIGFARPDGSFIDRVTYEAQAVDFSASREPDGSDAWVVEWHASPDQPNPTGPGQPIVGLEDVSASPEAVPAAGDLTELILGYEALPELELVVGDAEVASLLANPLTYVRAQIVFDGRSYGPVGVRLKGQNSFLPFDEKPSLRINVDEFVDGAKFFALDDLTLNNMSNDPAMMHERLAYYVAREAGIPASRATHARLTVNGEYYGLYTALEAVKRPMLERWFADGAGPLFEATDVDFAPQYVASYSLELGPDERGLLSGAASALTMADPDAAIAAAGSYVDIPQFFRYWAMVSVVGQFDAFPYSFPGDDYFVYADPTSARLHVLPWGMDETFFAADVDVVGLDRV
jgi:hypothetical protein